VCVCVRGCVLFCFPLSCECLCSLCSDNTRERALLVVAIEGEEAPGKERKQEEEEEEEEQQH